MYKVLIAEDDLLIAEMAGELLTEHGYRVCGIARTVAEAVALGRSHRPHLALIDLCLADGGMGTEIAGQLGGLARLGVLYTSGDMSRARLTAARGDACLAKPYRASELLRGLEIVADIVATGTAMPPFPAGFQVLMPAISAPRE